MFKMRASGVNHFWDNISRHTKTVTLLVYSDMVDDHAKIRCKRERIATDPGVEKLSDGMDVVA